MRTIHCSSRLPGGGGCLPLWTEFLTHACENITFLQLRLRTVIKVEGTFGDHVGSTVVAVLKY